MKITQCDRILNHLRDHGTITPDEADKLFGCKRLAARIADLRAKGYPKETKTKTGKNRFNETVSYAEYHLEEDKHE